MCEYGRRYKYYVIIKIETVFFLDKHTCTYESIVVHAF